MLFHFSVDIDFNNAAGFVGKSAEVMEAQYIVSTNLGIHLSKRKEFTYAIMSIKR